MKKQNRILKNRDFAYIIKKGNRFQTNSLSFYFLKNSNSNYRFGISISKKVSKLAVVRNKLKRQIIAIIDNSYDRLDKYDVVIIAKPTSLDIDFKELAKEINLFFSKIRERS